MDCHFHAARLGHRDDFFQKSLQVRPQALLSQLPVGGDKFPHLLLSIAGVPARQVDVVPQGIQALHLLPVHHQAGGAVGPLLVQLGPGPVKNRHKVVGHAFHAVLGAAADILAVDLQQPFHISPAQLNVLMNRDGLHHVEQEAVVLTVLLQSSQALLRPHFPGLNVIHCGDDAPHARDLADILQRDGIALSVPAE